MKTIKNMRYLKAIISTILLVLVPMIMMPIIQWWQKTFLDPNTELVGLYFLLMLISFGMLVITALNWMSAIHDKDIKDF